MQQLMAPLTRCFRPPARNPGMHMKDRLPRSDQGGRVRVVINKVLQDKRFNQEKSKKTQLSKLISLSALIADTHMQPRSQCPRQQCKTQTL